MWRGIAAVASAVVVLTLTACSPSPPELPDDSSPATVAGQVTGANGEQLLTEITTFDWPDDGRRAGELFGWIARDAESPDAETAKRAGATAQAIGTFLARNFDKISHAGQTNPALIQAYAAALSPYLGAMVGDPHGTSGFEPLDPLDSNMEATARVFAVMADGAPDFARAAADRAAGYERRFADYAAANPNAAIPQPQMAILLDAARLRGLIKVGAKLAGVQQDSETLQSNYGLQYLIVSRMVRGGDRTISPEFFNADGSLKSADELNGGVWSRYNEQVGNYLDAYPELTKAVKNFQTTLTDIGEP